MEEIQQKKSMGSISPDQSLETDFIFYIHKTLLSFSYLSSQHQRVILKDVQTFIHRLTLLFSNNKTIHKEEKRIKIIDILVKYLNRLHSDQIKHLIQHPQKDTLLKSIEKDAYMSTMNHLDKLNESKKELNTKEEVEEEQEVVEIEKTNMDDILEELEVDNNPSSSIDENLMASDDIIRFVEDEFKKYEKKMIEKIVECKRSISNVDRELDRKIELRLKSNLIEIENQVKKLIRDSLTNIYQMESQTTDKMNEMILQTKESLEKKMFEKMEDELKKQFEEMYSYLNSTYQDSIKNFEKVEEQTNSRIESRLLEYIEDMNIKFKENFRIILEKNKELVQIKQDLKESIRTQVDNQQVQTKEELLKDLEKKLSLFSDVFQVNFQDVIEKIHKKIKSQEESLQNFDIGTYDLEYQKDNHELHLRHNGQSISSIQLNIKGMIGPKGPQGIAGKTPKIKNIRFTKDSRVLFVIEGEDGDYELESDEKIPVGPSGPQGPKGEPGITCTDFKIQEKSILRVDHENLNNLILLKSLCVGEESHCLSEQSVAIGGAICYKPESFAIGKKSQTCDMNSIALFGSTNGKNAFAYRSQNVEDNQVKFGQNKNDIESFDIHSKKILLNSDEIELKGKVTIKHYEDRLSILERKLSDLLKKN